jgi:hypothetical protein
VKVQRFITCLALVLATAFATVCCAAAEDDKLQASVVVKLNQLVEVSEWPAGCPAHVQFSVVDQYTPSAADITAMETEVEGKPSHPLRRDIETYKRRLLRPDRSVRELYYYGSRWRYATKSEFASDYLDFGRDGDSAWVMIPKSLSISPTEAPPPGSDFASVWHIDVAESLCLITCGLNMFRNNQLTFVPEKVRLASEGWSIESEYSTERGVGKVSVQGEVRDGEILVSRCALVFTPVSGSSTGGTTWTATGWQRRGIGVVVASRVRIVSQSGTQSDRVFELEKADCVDAATVESVAAIPTLTQVDRIRGPVSFRAISDFRDQPTVTVVGPDGTTRKESLESLPYFAKRRSMEILGWVVCGCIVAILITVRLRKAR